MDNMTLLEWAFQQMGFAAVAVVSLYMLNAVWRQYTTDLKEMRQELLDAFRENTKALAELNAILRSVPSVSRGRF